MEPRLVTDSGKQAALRELRPMLDQISEADEEGSVGAKDVEKARKMFHSQLHLQRKGLKATAMMEEKSSDTVVHNYNPYNERAFTTVSTTITVKILAP